MSVVYAQEEVRETTPSLVEVGSPVSALAAAARGEEKAEEIDEKLERVLVPHEAQEEPRIARAARHWLAARRHERGWHLRRAREPHADLEQHRERRANGEKDIHQLE